MSDNDWSEFFQDMHREPPGWSKREGRHIGPVATLLAYAAAGFVVTLAAYGTWLERRTRPIQRRPTDSPRSIP